ncbi:MAG: hypothetical protein OXJ52_02975 [Oligoflexia bacterium]|nr:hypothetical protein [Oligoflexia bacterium]
MNFEVLSGDSCLCFRGDMLSRRQAFAGTSSCGSSVFRGKTEQTHRIF